MAADKDNSGALDRKEFAAVLATANIGVTPRQVRQLLAECDEDDNGVIEYRCAPLAVRQAHTLLLLCMFLLYITSAILQDGTTDVQEEHAQHL
jgi:hypothetical protein